MSHGTLIGIATVIATGTTAITTVKRGMTTTITVTVTEVGIVMAMATTTSSNPTGTMMGTGASMIVSGRNADEA